MHQVGMTPKENKLRGGSGPFWHEDVIGTHVAQNVAGNLFNDIWIGLVGRKQRHVALELRAHGLEALDLEIQQSGPFDQLTASVEAVAAMKRMKSEVGTRYQAGKQHQRLPNAGARPDLDFMRMGTQHGFTGLQFWGSLEHEIDPIGAG